MSCLMIVIVILEMVMVITGVIMVVIVMIKNNFISNESIHFSFFLFCSSDMFVYVFASFSC